MRSQETLRGKGLKRDREIATLPRSYLADCTCKKILVQAALERNAGGWVVGRKKNGGWGRKKCWLPRAQGGGLNSSRAELLARYTRTPFSPSAGDPSARANILARRRDWAECAAGLVKPSFTVPACPRSRSFSPRGESQLPRVHSWRANEVEKIKAVAGDH